MVYLAHSLESGGVFVWASGDGSKQWEVQEVGKSKPLTLQARKQKRSPKFYSTLQWHASSNP